MWAETIGEGIARTDPIVIDKIAEHLGAIGSIHRTPTQLNI